MVLASVQHHSRNLTELGQIVTGFHVPDRSGLGPHDHRVSNGSVGGEIDTPQVVTAGHARCREEDVVGADEVIGADHLLEVEAGFPGRGGLARRRAATGGIGFRLPCI